MKKLLVIGIVIFTSLPARGGILEDIQKEYIGCLVSGYGASFCDVVAQLNFQYSTFLGTPRSIPSSNTSRAVAEASNRRFEAEQAYHRALQMEILARDHFFATGDYDAYQRAVTATNEAEAALNRANAQVAVAATQNRAATTTGSQGANGFIEQEIARRIEQERALNALAAMFTGGTQFDVLAAILLGQ